MCSGIEPTADISGAPYVQASLLKTLGEFGPIFITAAMVLFAFTTLLGNLYYVDRSLHYILKRKPSRQMEIASHIIASAVIFIGSVLSADLLWGIADVTMGAMTIINMPVILFLGKYAIRALKDIDRQRKQTDEPVFLAKNIDLPHDTDYWK